MINPSRIYGIWDEGIVLDNHMQKSIFIGYDENGKEKFENTRTEIGELIYRYKYKNDKKALFLIIDDLYSTGNTLNEICRVLKQDKNTNKIYCLVITKTKR